MLCKLILQVLFHNRMSLMCFDQHFGTVVNGGGLLILLCGITYVLRGATNRGSRITESNMQQ